MKYYLLFLFISLYGISNVNAQNYSANQLDSLYSEFMKFHNPDNAGQQHRGILSVDTSYIKCSFGLVNEVKMNFNRFSSIQQKTISGLLSRPASDTSFVTPNGFFRVHFTKSDFPDYVPENIRQTLSSAQLDAYKRIYLDSLAVALDSAYNFEVNFLGYPPPPPDNGNGGDNKYDIYITSLGSSYGYTEYEDEVNPPSGKYTSFMVIDNSFSNFYTKRIDAARVTVAHEFHHSIQIGNYIYRYNSDAFFYELTSTSMEHFVYGSIHDYYQYLPSYFRNTQNSFTYNYGSQEYALAIWNIYLKDKFGYDIIKKEWELMPNMRAIKAIAGSLNDYNTSFGTEFSQFGIWTYYTNYRAKSDQYFKDASDYPLITPVKVIQFNSSAINLSGNTEPLTNSFVTIINPAKLDSLNIIITNSDVQRGIDSNSIAIPFEYDLAAGPATGTTMITNDYYYSFSTQQPAFWLNSAILNNIVIDSGRTGIDNTDYAYPSPFNYKNNYSLFLPVQPNSSGYAELDIYSISMKQVYTGSKQIIIRDGRKVLIWNALDNNNAKLASGVYIYVIKSGDNTTKGKLVIFDE